MISFTFASRSFEFGKLLHMRQFLKSVRLWNTRPLRTFMVQSLFFFQFVNVCYGQNSKSIDFQSGEKVSAENRAKAKKLIELAKKARQEKPVGPILSNRDIHKIYTPNPIQQDPLALALLKQTLKKNADVRRKLQIPKHRVSILSAPASIFGPISLGPAYGTLMFQNSLNYWPDWQGLALPWNGAIGARYLLSSGPLTIPYEMALQNRLVMTTITDAYGNQQVSIYDNSSGFSTQYQIIGRLDGNPPPATAGSIYGGGYYVSTYTGNIPGTNSSSFPGVFVPSPPFQTTFGYAGDLDTLGPLGRGHTPLNPPGPVPVMIPGFNAPNHAATILP